MSRTTYYVSTYEKQLEVAQLVTRLDREMSSTKARAREIEQKVKSLQAISPCPIADLRTDPGPLLNLTAEMDIAVQDGLIRTEGSSISKKIQSILGTMTVEPQNIQEEEKMHPEIKNNLAQVRKVTIDTVKDLVSGKFRDVKIESLKLLKQDGNVFDVMTTVQDSEIIFKVQSKICVLENGSVTIHQIGDYPSKVCNHAAKQIAAPIDMALSIAYSNQFIQPKARRSFSGNIVVGKTPIKLQKSMCG